MKAISTVQALREELAACHDKKIGFVPTMGALHEGHISLVERARKECDVVVVSVFVNPTQFNDKNDLRNYPRTPEADAAMLEAAGVDLVLFPSVEEIYPEPDTRQFDFGLIDKVMEGATRPGHFNGVAQVVSRLFAIVEPTCAYFGEKDFQQIAVISSRCCAVPYMPTLHSVRPNSEILPVVCAIGVPSTIRSTPTAGLS